MGVVQLWSAEHVFALAPKPSSIAAAQPLAVPSKWAATGCDDTALWGRCTGTSAEPYETMVDHVGVAFRCTCPSRVFPCKHALALLLLWTRGHVATAQPSAAVASWIAKRRATVDAKPPVADHTPATRPAAIQPADGDTPNPPAVLAPEPSKTRDDRIARMNAGMAELDRWLADRMRRGLTDPTLARYATWDAVAARLIDSQVGGLANRVRRLAGAVGVGPQWHLNVLAELGTLHLLATAGRHLQQLPVALADSVAAAVGWQVRQADVLGGVPHTAHWEVRGRSDTREDRIEVRRQWLFDPATASWAMILSFAAYGQSLDTTLPVGSTIHADVFHYPGALGIRCLVGLRHDAPVTSRAPAGVSVAMACSHIGTALVAEPWLERWPVTVRASVARRGQRWWLTDNDGAVPLVVGQRHGVLLAVTAAQPQAITCEWTADGFIPLAVHLADRTVDIGPTADPSFVSAA